MSNHHGHVPYQLALEVSSVDRELHFRHEDFISVFQMTAEEFSHEQLSPDLKEALVQIQNKRK